MKTEPALRTSARSFFVDGDVFRRDAIGPVEGLLSRVGNQDCPSAGKRLLSDDIFAKDLAAQLQLLCHALRQLARSGNENRQRFRIVLRLGNQISGDERRISVWLTITTSVGPASMSMAQSNATSLLCGGDIRISWTDDFVDARNTFGAIGQRSDRLARRRRDRTLRPPALRRRPELRDVGRGETTRIFFTPATCAGITVISNVETSGNRPPGT